ncbi:MAG: type III pantothenate kinase [Paludibacter sp.]|nr:type III pantothenate kinase [Paludibacter sp.]MDD4198992.1 type III pantothenate kinase [Paludibacter sp.]MDD4426818.1 type III pantothenate kinase [Paludibacter sp.]
MNLCIDQGNSSTKIAVFDRDAIVYEKSAEKSELKSLLDVFDTYPIEFSILSSVVELNQDLKQLLTERSKQVVFLDHHTPLPVVNAYKTPETLGKDRLAAVVGAAALQPDKDILIIDAGTAVTYDFIDASGVYHGGNIAPGIELRLKSLHAFTQKLPLVEVNANVDFLGTDTGSAIQSGVLYGIVLEIDGYVERLMLKYPKLSVFLTGGSAVLFENKLKSRIFADKNLVLTGLNRILQYNVKYK